MTNKELVNSKIDRVLSLGIFGLNFSFRSGQREAIEQICFSFLEREVDTVILDAPTGTGKSIIAMFASRVLEELGYRGYLITSDITLQDQYEKDIRKFGLSWGNVKGVDNYTCSVNKQKFSLGECKTRGMSYEKAMTLTCAETCGYLQNRKKAIESPVSLLNYSYWLVQRNYVEQRLQENGRNVPFPQRDFAFFDEAHKVDEIVQSHFSPRIDKYAAKKLSWVREFLITEGFVNDLPKYKEEDFEEEYDYLRREEDKFNLFNSLQKIEHLFLGFKKAGEGAKNTITKEYGEDFERNEIPSEWKKAFFMFDWIKDVHCKLEDYNAILSETGYPALVKRVEEKEINFQCIEERMLIEKYFQKKAGFKIFMSATIGDPRMYAQITSIKNAKVIRIDSGFDFEKSPVYIVDKFRLNYSKREENLPKVIRVMDAIIDKKHGEEKGIIHSGSYFFMNEILKKSKHRNRIIKYENTEEKRAALKKFSISKNAILIGPSILEGIDLYDDKSRFQIFFKVPFPSLADPLIKEKLKSSNGWYDWKTGINILQGVGRSIRNKEDWAVTYFLDACIMDLIRKPDYFPNEFKQRIKVLR